MVSCEWFKCCSHNERNGSDLDARKIRREYSRALDFEVIHNHMDLCHCGANLGRDLAVRAVAPQANRRGAVATQVLLDHNLGTPFIGLECIRAFVAQGEGDFCLAVCV